MRRLRILRLWLTTSFRAAPLLMTISTVLVAARAVTAPAQTYGVSRLVDGLATDQSGTIAVGIAIIVGGLAVSFIADGLGWPLQDTAQERMAGRVHADLLDVTTGIPGLSHHERPDVADRLELVRERAWRMGVGAEVLLWAFATVTNTVTVLTLLGSVEPLLLFLPLLGGARIWSAYLSSTRRHKAWGGLAATGAPGRSAHRGGEGPADRAAAAGVRARSGLARSDLRFADRAVPAPGRRGPVGWEGRRSGSLGLRCRLRRGRGVGRRAGPGRAGDGG